MKTLERKSSVKHVPSDAYWLGTNVFYLRQGKRWTQEKLAQAADITARRLRDIENADADTNVTVSTVSALARALEVDIKDLFKHHRRGDGVDV